MAEVIGTGVECNLCTNKAVHASQPPTAYIGQFPGWIAVIEGSDDRDLLTFCCYGCLETWCQVKRREALGNE